MNCEQFLPRDAMLARYILSSCVRMSAAVLKQQISKFYPQILSTEDSFYIYDRPLTEINVIASFCALNLLIKS